MDTLYEVRCGNQKEKFIADAVVSNDIPIASVRQFRGDLPSKIYTSIQIDDKKFKGEFVIIKDSVNVAWLVKKKDENYWKKSFLIDKLDKQNEDKCGLIGKKARIKYVNGRFKISKISED